MRTRENDDYQRVHEDQNLISMNKSVRSNPWLTLAQQETSFVQANETLVLPRPTLKRRTSIIEKSRDWARRFMTIGRSYRRATLNDSFRSPSNECRTFFSDDEKRYDEDGYLSPLEIKVQSDQNQSTKKCFDHRQTSLVRSRSCRCQEKTPVVEQAMFVSDFQQSLSNVDYIDFDTPEQTSTTCSVDEENDDALVCLRYLFVTPDQSQSRRIPRRTTNVSSISTDSGYCDSSTAAPAKYIPVQLISCTLLPVNIGSFQASHSSMFRHCSQRSDLVCTCRQRSHSTRFISHSLNRSKQQPFNPTDSVSLSINGISRWYRPDLSRDQVADALQQADYGAFIIRHSSTQTNCYVLSIKVPKFTHESSIVHYLIEKTSENTMVSYRIKGTIKRFPTLLSLLTHHSVMPEILPITLNFYESVSN